HQGGDDKHNRGQLQSHAIDLLGAGASIHDENSRPAEVDGAEEPGLRLLETILEDRSGLRIELVGVYVDGRANDPRETRPALVIAGCAGSGAAGIDGRAVGHERMRIAGVATVVGQRPQFRGGVENIAAAVAVVRVLGAGQQAVGYIAVLAAFEILVQAGLVRVTGQNRVVDAAARAGVVDAAAQVVGVVVGNGRILDIGAHVAFEANPAGHAG